MANKKFGYKKYLKQKTEKKDMSTLKVFLCSFVLMLVVFTVLINCFSPDVDVSIGNNNEEALDAENNIYLKKFVDDRLLTIQQEDLGQTGTSTSTTEKAIDAVEAATSSNTVEMKPIELVATVPEVKISAPKLVTQPTQPVSQEIQATYRVYIGHYHTYDQVKIAKEIVNETDPELKPVIKEVAGGYTLQAGVFKNKDAATVLTNTLLKEHLPARMITE